MTEPIDRSQLVEVILPLVEWEALLGQIVFQRDEKGRRLSRRKWDYHTFQRNARQARSGAISQILRQFPGKD